MNNGNNQNLNQTGPWWKPAMRVFGEVSTWIVVPIILALVVGKYLDGRWGTEPTMLLISFGIGFTLSTFGIVRAVKRHMDKITKNAEKNKNI